MNRNIGQYLTAATALLTLAACGVKDPILNTPHPAHGMVTLTTDWSGIGEGVTAPESYTVSAALSGSSATAPEYTATLTGVTNRLDHLFAPGNYRFLVHNTAEHITIAGVTATVAQAASPADLPGSFVHSAPGRLFASTADLAITADTEHALTANMRRQVGQLTLIIEPSGGTTHRIERIEGYLTGVASTFDIVEGTHSGPVNVSLSFSPVATAADAQYAGQWTATVRLLGTAGAAQKLVTTIHFADGSPGPHTVEHDISGQLGAFNAHKGKPLTLEGTVVETPTEAGFTATIIDWTPVVGSATAD